jgi:hypothetical protein
MDEIEVKVTWRFAWSLYWRMLLMGLGIGLIAWLIMLIAFMIVGGPICPYL